MQSNRTIPPKFLMVDDEGLMQALYQAHIERAGYQLVTEELTLGGSSS